MAGYDRASGVDAELKRVYSDKALEDTINRQALTYGKLTKSSKAPKGGGFYMGIISGGNERGQGAINELETLPTADKQHVKQCKIDPKIIVHVCRFSGLSMAMSQGDEAAFADVLTLGMEGAMKDVPKMMNQMVFRGSAWIGRVNGAVTADTTVTFDGAIRTHIREGMYVDFYNTDGSTLEASDVKISSVDYANLQFTVSSAITVTDNCYICRHSEKTNESNATDATMKAFNGFPQWVDDGTTYSTFENIARTGASAVSSWKGISINAGSIDFSDDNAQRVLMRMNIELGEELATRVTASTFQRRKYLALTAATVNVTTPGSATARDSGTKKQLYWNEMPIDFDPDCGEDEWYFWSPKYAQRFVVQEPSFENKFSGAVLKWDSGYDGCVAFMKGYLNIGTNNVKSIGRLNGNTVSSY